MKSFIYLVIFVLTIFISFKWWRFRVERFREEAAEREEAQAQALKALVQKGELKSNALVPQRAAPVQPIAPLPDVTEVEAAQFAAALKEQAAAASHRMSASDGPAEPLIAVMQAPVQSVHLPPVEAHRPARSAAMAVAPNNAGPAEAPKANGTSLSGPPPALILKTIKRTRFARVGAAYFEATGFTVKPHRGDAPVDVLLFFSGSTAPTMAVRWSRTLDKPINADEVAAFIAAFKALKAPRGTLLAQPGFEAKARSFANEEGVTLIDADGLAAKLTAVGVEHHAHLWALANGEKQ